MCGRHWKKVPAHLRTAIWKEYRPGQEETKIASNRYLEAARAAIAIVKRWEVEGR